MNSNLKKLIEVNQFDLEISKFNPLIEEKKAPIYAKSEQKEKYEKEKANLQAKIRSNEDLLSKSNADLGVIAADLEKIKEKIKESKSEKEMKNLSMEEDILNEKVTGFNAEIDALEKQNVQAKEKIESLDSNIANLDSEIAKINEACSGDIEKIKKEQDAVSAKRQKVALEMDGALLRLYEKIRKWAGNSSVIPIYKNACGGCFIRLSDKNVIDIKKGEEIVHCPHCGRILYDGDETSDVSDKKDSKTIKDSAKQSANA